MTGCDGFDSRQIVLLAAGIAAVFALGTGLAPALEAAGATAGTALRGLYRPLCHQIPSRSLHAAGFPMAVCARCAGLYFGGALGLMAAALLRFGHGQKLRGFWFFVGVAPTALEALARLAGWSGAPNVPRLLLAVPAGFVAAIFLAVGITDLVELARASSPSLSGKAAGSDSRPT